MSDRFVVVTEKQTNDEVLYMLEDDFFSFRGDGIQNALDYYCKITDTDYDQYTINTIDYQSIKKPHVFFQSGNVVQYDGMIFVVSEYKPEKRTVCLLSTKRSNVRFIINDKFPHDPRMRISSVTLLADTLEDYITNRLKGIIFNVS